MRSILTATPESFSGAIAMNTNPSNFAMTLGTARAMVAQPTHYKPHMVAEARRVVAYWARRAAKKAATR